jgi:predicted RNA-binding Zn ribbon-like protein
MVSPWTFHTGAGALCLDFANTLSWRRAANPVERLQTYADLGSWARQLGLVSRRDELRLRRAAAMHPRRAAQVLARARALRETTFAIFAAISEGRAPTGEDVRSLEAWLKLALAGSRLDASDGRYQWVPAAGTGMAPVLWRVALSAGELLGSDQTARIGQCAGRDCRWLWLDRTRNQSRRWCDMAVCGNRAKARQYAQRQRALVTSRARASGPSAERRSRRLAASRPATDRRKSTSASYPREHRSS